MNDNSNDKTELIIKEILSKDKRIKAVNHFTNLGLYGSKVDIFNFQRKIYIT